MTRTTRHERAMTREMERTELIARESIRDLLSRYTWAADRGRSTDVAACFLADGVLDVGEHGGAWNGREAISQQLVDVAARISASSSVQPVNHHVSSIHIQMHDPTAAKVRSYFCVFTPSGPDHWGTYADEVALDPENGHWAFVRREVRVLGHAPNSRFVST